MKRGPKETARDALKILESMRGGEPVDEEIADVLTDAVWEAYANGLENGKASRSRKASPAGDTNTSKEGTKP